MAAAETATRFSLRSMILTFPPRVDSMSLIRCTALGCRRKNGVNGDTPQGQLFVYGNQHKVYDMTTQHLYYQTSGSRTTPSGMISPMSPEWNLNTAARYGPMKQRKGSTSKALCQPSLSKSAASLDLWKKHDAKTHIILKHT